VPGLHEEGHCIFGGDYLIPETATYVATYVLRASVSASHIEDETEAVLDIYENLQTKRVLAERRIARSDIVGSPLELKLQFVASEDQCVEFRIYWAGTCQLTVESMSLEKVPVAPT
jgi:hypothetical protein